MTETWDETKPAGSRNPKLGDDDIREFKRAMRERLAEDHEFQATESPAFGDTGYKIGKHKYVTLIEQTSDKTTLENEIAVVAKDDGSNPEIFLIPESAGTAKKLTQSSVTKLADNWLSGVNLNTAGERPKIFTGIGVNGNTYSIDFPTQNLNTTQVEFLTGDQNTIAWWGVDVAPPGWVLNTLGKDTVLAVKADNKQTGDCTSISTDKLIDGAATFVTNGVNIGDLVHNITDSTYATVLTVDSETQLTLDTDIMDTLSDAYEVGSQFIKEGGLETGAWQQLGHTLAISEIPAHDHGGATGGDGNHNHTFGGEIPRYGTTGSGGSFGDTLFGGAKSQAGNVTISTEPAHTHTISSQGGGGAHDHGKGWRMKAIVGRLYQFDTT